MTSTQDAMPKLPRRLASPLVKVLRKLYYRRLYGTGGRLERLVAGVVERWEAGSGRGDVPLAAAAWEDQYAQGAWDFLRDSDELARYGIIGTYLHHRGFGQCVLDVGCGEGLLTAVMAPRGGRRFVGIDVSAAAIERARRRFDPPESSGFGELCFEAADAETWPGGELEATFDAVVFNESAYYFQHPLETVARYAVGLRPGGVLIVSMFETLRSVAIGRQLARTYAVVDQFDLAGAKGRWRIQVLQPVTR